MKSPESEALLQKFQTEAKMYPILVIGGHLGSYMYYDMDQAMADALELNIV